MLVVMIIESSRPWLFGAVALGLLACGPTPPSGNPTGDDASSTSTTTTTETGAPGETGTETGESPTTEGPGVTVAPDMPPVSCDPWTQDCPEGEKCVPYASSGQSWDANKCVPVLGDQAAGEPCSSAGPSEATDDCDATGYCFNLEEIDGELLGTCVAFCTGTPAQPECPSGFFCSIDAAGVLDMCLRRCDPVAQDCPDGDGCYWASPEFTCIPPAADNSVGEPCDFAIACAPGHICLDQGAFPDCAGEGCCASFCSLALGDGPCEAQLPGTVCVSFFTPGEAPDGYEDVGVCTAPPP